MDAARIRILVSWSLAGLGGLVGLSLGGGQFGSTILAAILGAYLSWSLFWGIPPVWRGWLGILRSMGCFIVTTPFGWLVLLVAFFYIPLVGGYLYGVLGGAIYEYWKCHRVALGMRPQLIASAQHEPSLEEMMANAEARRSWATGGPEDSEEDR